MSDDADGAVGLERASLPELDGAGRAALFEGEPRTVRLALEAGESIPAHRHPGRDVVCHLLSGRMELTLAGETVSLEAGDVVRFDGAQDISPRAETDCEAVLVLAASA